MWPFTKKYCILESGLLEGFTDFHSHILPGVDDGIRTLAESLEVLSWYEKTGIREVWLTPHIMDDIPNTPASLREGFDSLQEAWKGSVKLNLAAENMLDNLFEERFDAGDLLKIGKSGVHILVETSYFNPPMGFEDTLARLSGMGHRPLLAHPERYVYMSMKDYRSLKSSGVALQLNVTSLCGAYGEEAEDKARTLLREGMYDACGTDVHRLRALKWALTQKKLSSKDLNLLENLVSNPCIQ